MRGWERGTREKPTPHVGVRHCARITLTVPRGHVPTRIMTKLLSIIATACCVFPVAPALAQNDDRSAITSDVFARLRASHIDGNVPAASDFQKLLRRDVSAYLIRSGAKPSTLAIELLRDGPTQSGVSYPKFYLWVRAITSQGTVVEGAMRVAAVERTHFDVLQFATMAAIRNATAELPATFPAQLIPLIEARARQ